jgi:hypothetical protein
VQYSGEVLTVKSKPPQTQAEPHDVIFPHSMLVPWMVVRSGPAGPARRSEQSCTAGLAWIIRNRGMSRLQPSPIG